MNIIDQSSSVSHDSSEITLNIWGFDAQETSVLLHILGNIKQYYLIFLL